MISGYLRSQITLDYIPVISEDLRLADYPRLPQISHQLRANTGHLRLSYWSSQVKLRLADDLRLPQISDHIRLLVLSGYLTGHLRLS